MSRLRSLTTLAAAVLVTAAATLALPAAPAQAAYCSGGAGVSVYVDFGALGGGTATGCGGGASVASTAFQKAGFSLAQSPRQPGFVCQVNGLPKDPSTCMGTASYWGFFVSDDGKGWVYASQGVYQEAVDSGDSVALVWQSTTSKRAPGVAPAPSAGGQDSVAPAPTATRRPKPKPKPATPSPTPSARPTPTRSATAVAPTSTPSVTPTHPATPSATPSKARSRHKRAAATPTPTASATTAEPLTSATPTTTTDATEPTASDGGGGLPVWLPPVLVVVLAGAAGSIAWARRAR